MTESKLRFWEIALLFALAAALMWGSWSLQQQDRLERKMIRLHVIANSDSEADQALKLQVRDRVLTLATDILRRADSREQAERDRPRRRTRSPRRAIAAASRRGSSARSFRRRTTTVSLSPQGNTWRCAW